MEKNSADLGQAPGGKVVAGHGCQVSQLGRVGVAEGRGVHPEDWGTRENLSRLSHKAVGKGGERKADQQGNAGEWRGGALPWAASLVNIWMDRGSDQRKLSLEARWCHMGVGDQESA